MISDKPNFLKKTRVLYITKLHTIVLQLSFSAVQLLSLVELKLCLSYLFR